MKQKEVSLAKAPSRQYLARIKIKPSLECPFPGTEIFFKRMLLLVAVSFNDFQSVHSLIVFDYLKLDILTALKGTETVPLDCSVMHKDILAIRVEEEAEALFAVKPFDLTLWHKLPPKYASPRFWYIAQ